MALESPYIKIGKERSAEGRRIKSSVPFSYGVPLILEGMGTDGAKKAYRVCASASGGITRKNPASLRHDQKSENWSFFKTSFLFLLLKTFGFKKKVSGCLKV